MAANFPSSPAENQMFSPNGIVSYVYRSGAWHQVYGKPMRNRLNNPHLLISQENGEAVGHANGYYHADQWYVTYSSPTGSINVGRTTTADGRGIYLQISTVAANPDYLMFAQNIEGWRVSDLCWGIAGAARPAVLSFMFYATRTGQFSVSLRCFPSVNHSFVAPFTVTAAEANTWVRRVIPIPAYAAGTWEKESNWSINLMITLASATALQNAGWYAGNAHGVIGQSNGMSTTGMTYILADVSLTVDPDGFGNPPRPEREIWSDSYRNCQRYYEKVSVTAVGGMAVNPLPAWGYKVMKRIDPVKTLIGGAAGGATYAPIQHDGLWGFRQYTQSTNAVDHILAMSTR